MEKARFFAKKNGQIRCRLCPHNCLIEDENEGICGVRVAKGGQLYSLNYGLCAAINFDPVEKKPLYHFYPGRYILSIGTYGCNLSCSFCQNWGLARGKPSGPAATLRPKDVLERLDSKGGPEKALGVAYTYNEPTVWYEFMYDTARLLNSRDYKNVMVTNGYINREPLEQLLPYIDAMNIDLKSFNDQFYRTHCGGLKAPVLKTIERAVESCHVEITCLLIPTLNDKLNEVEGLSRWLGSLNRDIPLHFSRYFPQHKMELPPTPPHVLRQAREVALKYLNYVYLGNVDLPEASDTVCPHCCNLLVARNGYNVMIVGLDGEKCQNCGNVVKLVRKGGSLPGPE